MPQLDPPPSEASGRLRRVIILGIIYYNDAFKRFLFAALHPLTDDDMAISSI